MKTHIACRINLERTAESDRNATYSP